jgi:hypothetical protein
MSSPSGGSLINARWLAGGRRRRPADRTSAGWAKRWNSRRESGGPLQVAISGFPRELDTGHTGGQRGFLGMGGRESGRIRGKKEAAERESRQRRQQATDSGQKFRESSEPPVRGQIRVTGSRRSGSIWTEGPGPAWPGGEGSTRSGDPGPHRLPDRIPRGLLDCGDFRRSREELANRPPGGSRSWVPQALAMNPHRRRLVTWQPQGRSIVGPERRRHFSQVGRHLPRER